MLLLLFKEPPFVVEPGLFSNTQTFYGATIVLSAGVVVQPGLFTNGQTFYGARLSALGDRGSSGTAAINRLRRQIEQLVESTRRNDLAIAARARLAEEPAPTAPPGVEQPGSSAPLGAPLGAPEARRLDDDEWILWMI